jgi:alpha-L-arabinofuranosidase
VELQGAKLTGKGTLRVIAHSDPMAYNEPGKPPNVVIEEKSVNGIADKLNVQPYSVNIYELAVR